MKRIKIINGVYGHRLAGTKAVDPKQAGDPPFEVDDGEAERLVSLGVAAYVPAAPVATSQEGESDAGATTDPPDESGGTEGTEDPPPDYSADMSAEALRDLMSEYGLPVKAGMSKANMVAALDEYFADVDAEEDEDGEGLPDVAPEEPVT
ncbi:MAG: hypothetical protein LBK75_08655 [Oscillospiraceae bacterium]|jgi:hypothetical protein|nr:hypothetical protein [Oscillospiraceae bacterium]